MSDSDLMIKIKIKNNDTNWDASPAPNNNAFLNDYWFIFGQRTRLLFFFGQKNKIIYNLFFFPWKGLLEAQHPITIRNDNNEHVITSPTTVVQDPTTEAITPVMGKKTI